MFLNFRIVILCLITAISANAQRTTRPQLKLREKADTQQDISGDTMINVADSIKISGYEKTLRASTESMFITNRMSKEMHGINVTIEYLDMRDRQLHQRTETFPITIPPHQTRMLQFPSWDKQKVWYYHLSQRTKTKNQATPYNVALKVNYCIVE